VYGLNVDCGNDGETVRGCCWLRVRLTDGDSSCMEGDADNVLNPFTNFYFSFSILSLFLKFDAG
jgi:hypothetical protein